MAVLYIEKEGYLRYTGKREGGTEGEYARHKRVKTMPLVGRAKEGGDRSSGKFLAGNLGLTMSCLIDRLQR